MLKQAQLKRVTIILSLLLVLTIVTVLALPTILDVTNLPNPFVNLSIGGILQ